MGIRGSVAGDRPPEHPPDELSGSDEGERHDPRPASRRGEGTRSQEGEELRRLVDRMGQPRRGADREGERSMKAVEVGGGRWGTGEVAQREPALWGLVGNTPLIPFPTSTNLHRPSPSLFLKAEWLNPGGPV